MIFGASTTYNKKDILNRVGCIDQICSARKMRFADGSANQMETIDIRTGSGLSFQILNDRGMGLGKADYKGIPLAWVSPILEVAPWFYQPTGNGWLGTFGGGLMTSCGLTNVGSPSIVDGSEIGLHGRISHIPASDVCIDKKWRKDGSYRIKITGTVFDHRVLGHSLELKRSYEIKMGESTIKIHDEICNLGNKPEPLMILYHFNFGYPLISETTKITMNPKSKIMMRDKEFNNEIKEWNVLHHPQIGYSERVYHHLFEPKEKGDLATITIQNQIGNMRLSAHLDFPIQSLNRLVQWKMLGEKEYVLGIEPANCFSSGRDNASEQGELEFLNAGDTKSIDITLRIESV